MRLLRLQGFLNSAQNKKGVSLMGKIKDLAGQRFGELTVIEPAERSPKAPCFGGAYVADAEMSASWRANG